MASGAYDSSQPPLPAGNTFRRTSGNVSYDTPPNSQGQRGSPSLALPARRTSAPYDNYTAPRGGPSYRDEFPNANNYRPDPNTWRPPPGRSSSTYYSRSPSPNRYDRPRSPEQSWHPSRISAPGPWQPSASSWSRPPVPTSPSASRDRPQRDIMAQSMSQSFFEPSNTWKKTHDRNEVPPSSVNRFSASRPPPPRRPISPRNDYAPPYYAAGDSYRPPPVVPTYRDPHSVPRANNYRPQYDDINSWAQPFPREPSQPLSAGYRRDSGPPARNAWAGDSYRSYSSSPDPLLRGRPPRRRSRDSQYRDSRSRSRSRSSPYASSSKALSATSRGKRGAPHRISSKYRSRSRSFSRSRSRSRSRSSSSSDVASTRASARSSREPPQKPPQQLPQHSLPAKPLREAPSIGSLIKPTISLPSRPAPVVQQKKPAENTGTSTSQIQQPPVSTPISTQQIVQKDRSTDKAGGPAMSKAQHQNEPISKAVSNTPKLAIETNFSGNAVHRAQPASANISSAKESIPAQIKTTQLSAQPRSSEVKAAPADKASRTSKATTQNTAPRIVEPSGKSAPAPKVVANHTSLTAVGGRPGKDAGVNFSSPLSSPDRSLKVDIDLTKREKGVVQMPPPSAKLTEMSDATTDDDEKLPNLSDARSIADALRIVVMTRLRYDRQTREERVNPVLMANRSITQPTLSRPQEVRLSEMENWMVLDSKMRALPATRRSLVARFEKRQEALSEKTERLREEYLTLHERWQAHCAKLDNKSNKKTNKDTPGTTDEAVVPASSGRSTRRTAAMLGDAVRSDLEMEQIIASLGVEELTDPNHLALRNLANIPDMISVSHGEVDYLFDDTNNLVDNPIEFYDDSKGVDVWTDEEKEIFLEQFAANPKQFGVIASFLPAKTAAQCVTYYYLHKKKHVDFRKIISLYAPGKRRRGGRRTDKQKGNALMADIRQHDDEVSLSHSGPTTRRKRGILPAATKPAVLRLGTRMELTPTSTPTPDPEPEVRKRGRRPNASARIASALADDVDNDSTITEPKPAKRGRKPGRKPKTPVLVPDDPPTPSSTDGNLNESTSRRKSAAVNVHWSDDDKRQFLHLLSQHGADFKRIAASMPNKTTIQVNNFYKSNVAELDLDKVAARAPKRSPTPETAKEGWSKYPGSGVMSPVAGATETVTEGLSRIDIDRQLPANGHASLKKVNDLLSDQSSQSTFASGSSGDLSGTSDRRSGLTEPAQQLVNIPNDSLQQQQHSQKQLQFSRFVPSEISASANHLPVNQYSTPAIPSSSTFSYTNYPSSRYPNHEARVANRHGPLIFREQSGVRPSSGRVLSGHNSYQNSSLKPSSGSLPHSTAYTADRILPRNGSPPAFGSISSGEYNMPGSYTDHR